MTGDGREKTLKKTPYTPRDADGNNLSFWKPRQRPTFLAAAPITGLPLLDRLDRPDYDISNHRNTGPIA